MADVGASPPPPPPGVSSGKEFRQFSAQAALRPRFLSNLQANGLSFFSKGSDV